MTFKDLINTLAKRFKKVGIATYRLDAEVLVMGVLKCTRSTLYRDLPNCVPSPTLEKIEALARRREKREPIAYLLSEKEFWGEHFVVRPGVLIPRPETETVIETALSFFNEKKPKNIIDLGTGCGALAITLAKIFPQSQVFAVDSSSTALQCAKENAVLTQLEERIQFYLGDLFEALPAPVTFDLVVANLPYVPSEDWETLPPEVRYEPKSALDGGKNGLAIICRALDELATFMPHGLSLFEIGTGQALFLGSYVRRLGVFEKVSVQKDLSGVERVIVLQK